MRLPVPGDPTMFVQPAAFWKRGPRPELAPFVEEYALRDERLGDAEVYNPLPARTDCFLQFYLRDLYKVVTVASGAVHEAPRSVLVGPHTRRREDLLWTGHLRVFTIRFTEVGFRAFSGLPMAVVRDYAGPADAVLGPSLRELEDAVTSAREEDIMPLVERCLLQRCRHAIADAADFAPSLRMARMLKRTHGSTSIELLADRHGYSVRQVERLFQEHVGVPPKLFGRLARLKRAMRLASADTTLDWASVAGRAGYFDQSHMVREFQALNGATPVQFRALGLRAARLRQMRSGDVAFVLSGREHPRLVS